MFNIQDPEPIGKPEESQSYRLCFVSVIWNYASIWGIKLKCYLSSQEIPKCLLKMRDD